MTYTVTFSEDIDKTLAKFRKSNPAVYKKLMNFFHELMEHPRSGTGHVEPLLKGNSVTYSRTITKKDRLIYDVYDDEERVEILQIESHYGDK
ncbi:addiction module toxin, Txe/YoeB family [Bacteroidales bacterium Barb6XT]|nr:addiction module toxin, Txe/YoeB family [Bacteroidales bacterium Barb4]OAV67067.1 addiction module toxin, Txe/YoeB family [Bacteroidales bacterium Barb6XT]